MLTIQTLSCSLLTEWGHIPRLWSYNHWQLTSVLKYWQQPATIFKLNNKSYFYRITRRKPEKCPSLYKFALSCVMYNFIKTEQYFKVWQLCRSCRDKSCYHDYINNSRFPPDNNNPGLFVFLYQSTIWLVTITGQDCWTKPTWNIVF